MWEETTFLPIRTWALIGRFGIFQWETDSWFFQLIASRDSRDEDRQTLLLTTFIMDDKPRNYYQLLFISCKHLMALVFRVFSPSVIKYTSLTLTSWFLPSAKEVRGKVIFSQACVIPSVHWAGGGGVVAFQHASQVTWPGGLLPGGICIREGWAPPNRIRSTSGRYASYWNAFLFSLLLDLFWLESKTCPLKVVGCLKGTLIPWPFVKQKELLRKT